MYRPGIQYLATLASLGLLLTMPPGAQAAGHDDLQKQIDGLTASQEALRNELRAMQGQLVEIRTLLQARPAAAAPAALPAQLTTTDAEVRGSATAVLTMVEFSDFQCPYCGRSWRDNYPPLERDYITTGKLRYVFRYFPLQAIHPLAFKASEAAACAGAQGRFWEMHDRLLSNQKALQPDDLVAHAAAVGLDPEQFATCLAGQMAPRIRQDMDLATQAGVSATPTFFVGTTLPDGSVKVLRKLSGALPYATFKAAIEGALMQVAPAP